MGQNLSFPAGRREGWGVGFTFQADDSTDDSLAFTKMKEKYAVFQSIHLRGGFQVQGKKENQLKRQVICAVPLFL